MGFLDKKKKEQSEMEVIEEEIEEAEEEIKDIKSKEPITEEKEEIELMVVRKEDIPMQEVRLITRENGSKVQLITIEEALSKIMNS
jgi:hypothetical protein